MKLLQQLIVFKRSTTTNLNTHFSSRCFHPNKDAARRLLSTTSSSSSSSTQDYSIKLSSPLVLVTVSLFTGYFAGRWSHHELNQPPSDSYTNNTRNERVLPSGTPRGCCCESSSSSPNLKDTLSLTQQEQDEVIRQLTKIVGMEHVVSGMHDDSSNAIFLKGARIGRGQALAIVTPITLEQAVQCLQVIVDTGCVCLPQGANTGLTGGSVPRHCVTHIRPTVILNMRQLDTMFPIDGGRRVVCLAGAGIATLSQNLKEWGFDDRESHSTLGSTFLNPTTAAGEC